MFMWEEKQHEKTKINTTPNGLSEDLMNRRLINFASAIHCLVYMEENTKAKYLNIFESVLL